MHDLIALRYAVLAAATFSFARAAQQLGVKQATLSRRIAGLETRLGVKLFDRSTRGAVPTTTGRRFIEIAQQILTDLDTLGSCGRIHSPGFNRKLRLGFSGSLAAGAMRSLLMELAERFPDLQVEGVERDRADLIRFLHTHVVDVAFLCGGVDEGDLKRRSTWAERVMVVLPTTDILAERERLYWPDLRHGQFFISRQDPGSDLANLARARLSEPGLTPDIQDRAIGHDNMLSLVSIGHCLTLTTDAALGRPVPGAVMKEVYDLSGLVTRIHFSAYWREDNDNVALATLLRIIGDRYPG